jgi:hypothetical protein
MTAMLLLTAEDCHLCAHARDVLDALARDGLLSWQEVDGDSDQGRRLAAAAPPPRPVLFDTDGRVLAYGRLSARRLRRQLEPAVAQTAQKVLRLSHQGEGRL